VSLFFRERICIVYTSEYRTSDTSYRTNIEYYRWSNRGSETRTLILRKIRVWHRITLTFRIKKLIFTNDIYLSGWRYAGCPYASRLIGSSDVYEIG